MDTYLDYLTRDRAEGDDLQFLEQRDLDHAHFETDGGPLIQCGLQLSDCSWTSEATRSADGEVIDGVSFGDDAVLMPELLYVLAVNREFAEKAARLERLAGRVRGWFPWLARELDASAEEWRRQCRVNVEAFMDGTL